MDYPVKISRRRGITLVPTLELTFDPEICLVPHQIYLKAFSMLIGCICEAKTPNFVAISYFGHACPYFLCWTSTSKMRNTVIFVSISRLTGKCATQKLKNFCSSSLWTCSHHYGHIKKLK